MKLGLTSLAFAIIIFFAACSSSNVEEDFPPDPCATTAVTYSGDVLPIIKQNCDRCHGTDTRFGGVLLEGYSNIAAYANSGAIGGVLRAINGYPIMPNDGVKMLECDILAVEQWIAAGAENN